MNFVIIEKSIEKYHQYSFPSGNRKQEIYSHPIAMAIFSSSNLENFPVFIR